MSEFLSGIIEGFYGRAWSWQARRTAVDFLGREQFNTYVYAPKSAVQLRRGWRERYAVEEFARLLQLREHCRGQGVRFGVGFSPWGLQDSYAAEDRSALQVKLRELNALDCDVLCILFDDMPGAIADLAERQVAIVNDIIDMSVARRHIVCPTYYSFDPVLEQVFGAMPPLYLETLGALLPATVDFFWTGPLVLSPGYDRADIEAIAARIDRKPLLWDNYPVNDGARISRFLHLLPVRARPSQLRDWCSGLLANPMNQPLLSRLPLASLASSLRVGGCYAPEHFWDVELEQYVAAELALLLRRDVDAFQRRGLDQLPTPERERLIADYQRITDPAALEVIDWLRDGYQFDPQCLTD